VCTRFLLGARKTPVKILHREQVYCTFDDDSQVEVGMSTIERRVLRALIQSSVIRCDVVDDKCSAVVHVQSVRRRRVYDAVVFRPDNQRRRRFRLHRTVDTISHATCQVYDSRRLRLFSGGRRQTRRRGAVDGAVDQQDGVCDGGAGDGQDVLALAVQRRGHAGNAASSSTAAVSWRPGVPKTHSPLDITCVQWDSRRAGLVQSPDVNGRLMTVASSQRTY